VPGIADAPSLFVSVLPIEAEPGSAQISNAGKQFGTITLQSETRLAYHFIPVAERLRMTAAIDLATIELGIEAL